MLKKTPMIIPFRMFRWFLTLLIIVISIDSYSQKDFGKEYSSFTDSISKEYSTFTETNENYYQQSLLKDWKSFNEVTAKPSWPAPKKPEMPVTKTRDSESKKVINLPKEKVIKQPAPVRKTRNAKPLLKTERHALKEQPTQQNEHKPESINFFGHKLAKLKLKDSVPALKDIDRQSLIHYRKQWLALQDTTQLQAQLKSQAANTTTGQWPQLQLTRQHCSDVYSSTTEITSCQWILSQFLGLDVRLGVNNKKLYLLAASRQQWYDINYYEFSGQRFYSTNLETLPSTLQIHTQHHPDAAMKTIIKPSTDLKPALSALIPREMTWPGKNSLVFNIDQDHIDYLGSIPQLSVSNYLHDKLPEYLEKQLSPQFHRTIGNTNVYESLGSLLKLLHNQPYQSDEKQFQRERSLTPSETLYYPASDCEDRVFLLKQLTQWMGDIKFAALRFPGHLSAAVKIADQWVEVDPTYFGAEIGDRQPKYKNEKPKMIF